MNPVDPYFHVSVSLDLPADIRTVIALAETVERMDPTGSARERDGQLVFVLPGVAAKLRAEL